MAALEAAIQSKEHQILALQFARAPEGASLFIRDSCDMLLIKLP